MKNKIVDKIRQWSWQFFRNRINQRERARLTATDVSVLSNDCTGGLLLHDLGMRFLSPTVNMYMRAEDYQKFCENLKYYLCIDTMVECTDPAIIEGRKYPLAYLGDILLYLVHYHSVKEAQNKWNDRKRRINWDKIVVINSDRNGMTDALKDRFEKLPYKKVMFTHLPDNLHPSAFYLTGSESEPCLGLVPEPYGWFGKKRTDRFDFVDFLNKA